MDTLPGGAKLGVNQPFFIILNVAVEGTFRGDQLEHETIKVDCVRVCQPIDVG
jgi:hypothetical protein